MATIGRPAANASATLEARPAAAVDRHGGHGGGGQVRPHVGHPARDRQSGVGSQGLGLRADAGAHEVDSEIREVVEQARQLLGSRTFGA